VRLRYLEHLFTTFLITGTALAAFFGLVQQTAIVSFIAIATWLQWLGTQIINGWNAVVWFVGTPFRALDASAKEMEHFLSPYITFLANAFQRALDDLAAGAETLRQSTDYAANNMQSSN
jgi:hypothetical protein